MELLYIIFGIAVIAAVVVLLIKKYETRMVLIGAGFLMAIVALKPLNTFEAFSNTMVTSGLIEAICSVLGFALVLKITRCDTHLIHLLTGALKKVRFALIPLTVIITSMINISLMSAAGVSAAAGAIFIPLLITAGIHPAMAASAVMAGTFGSQFNPGNSHNVYVADIMVKTGIVDATALDVIKVHYVTSIGCILIGAIALFIVAYLRKEHKDYVTDDTELLKIETESIKPNPFYALIPVLPVILLVAFSIPSLQEHFEWMKRIKISHVMIFGSFLAIVATRTNPAKATINFFDGMGKAYGDIIGIIIAAGVFVAGMKSLGMIDAFNAKLVESEGLASIAGAIGPFVLAIITGSGDAATMAFNNAITYQAADFGTSVAKLGSLATLGGVLGRTMSPIAGACLICAGLAKVNPLEIAKRNAPGMLIALVFSYIMLN